MARRRVPGRQIARPLSPGRRGLQGARWHAPRVHPGLATFAATSLTGIVATVHAVNHDARRVPPPEILAVEVPAAARKLYLEVLRLVGASRNGESPADWVDGPALLDQLGVPIRTAPARADGQEQRSAWAPRDTTGEREERREDARTPEGEDATGAHGEGESEG